MLLWQSQCWASMEACWIFSRSYNTLQVYALCENTRTDSSPEERFPVYAIDRIHLDLKGRDNHISLFFTRKPPLLECPIFWLFWVTVEGLSWTTHKIGDVWTVTCWLWDTHVFTLSDVIPGLWAAGGTPLFQLFLVVQKITPPPQSRQTTQVPSQFPYHPPTFFLIKTYLIKKKSTEKSKNKNHQKLYKNSQTLPRGNSSHLMDPNQALIPHFLLFLCSVPVISHGILRL